MFTILGVVIVNVTKQRYNPPQVRFKAAFVIKSMLVAIDILIFLIYIYAHHDNPVLIMEGDVWKLLHI